LKSQEERIHHGPKPNILPLESLWLFLDGRND
jgi:hypothetical protein